MAPDLVLLSRVSFRDRPIAGPRLQSLLALLAADLPTGCGVARLIDELWPDRQPDNPVKSLHILVSRARSQLGADVIDRTPAGYRLTLPDERVDSAAVLLRAAAATRCARSGDHAGALAEARAGLALWTGAGPGAGEGSLGALRAERWVTHQALVRGEALALARLHRPAEAVATLAALAADHPRDEELLLELLRCEAATAGPAAALARYDTYRRALRDELGTDPGEPLRAEHRRLLRPALRHGVTHEPNPLLGRDDDIAAVEALLRTGRVTSIVGPGGLGKTRLAQAVARRAAAPTVVVVPLAGITSDPAREVATALGVGTDGIAGRLAGGPALLVLDNAEHVVDEVAGLVRALVGATAELRVLVTSRTPLGLSSESVHPLPELDLATSAELFAQRARAARPGAELPAATVAEVCRHLDGLPLAVELAAARVRMMSVTELARRLDDRFGLLRGAARDAPARHQTLHAVVDWSWALLTPAGRQAMRALSIFPDGFPPGAAASEAVLEHLVDHSLLKVVDTPAGTRLRMLETVREFSAARRDEAGETEAATTGFLRWARDFGVAHHAGLFGAEPAGTVAAIRADRENLLLALRIALARDDRATIAAVAAVLAGVWYLESNTARLGTLVAETARPLSHYRPEPALVEATRTALTVAAGHTFGQQGPRPARALVALRRLGTARPDTLIRAVGWVAAAPDDRELRRLGESTEPLLAAAANLLLSYRGETGDPGAALAAARRAVDLFTERGLPWPRALSHCRAAELCLRLDRSAEARDHLTAALPVLDRLAARADAMGVRSWLVLAHLRGGDTAEAERWLDTLARHPLDEEVSRSLGHSIGYDLGVRAEVLLARGEAEAGLRLWRRAVELLRGADGDGDLAVNPWAVEARAVAVVAHARHGRLDLVDDVADELPGRLTRLLAHPTANPPPYLAERTLCGTLLLAVGTADRARGRPAAAADRMIALAGRFGYLRNFQPTMPAAPAGDVLAGEHEVAGLRVAALDLLDQRVRSRL